MPDKDFADYDCVDMEGAAMAAVCKSNDVPFASVKIVSDSGSNDDWESNAEKVRSLFDRAYLDFASLL
jgi:nucleoside phosphorylase